MAPYFFPRMIIFGVVMAVAGFSASLKVRAQKPAKVRPKSYTKSREIQSHGSLIRAASTKQNKTKQNKKEPAKVGTHFCFFAPCAWSDLCGTGCKSKRGTKKREERGNEAASARRARPA
jgi:hypothetical protein